MAQFHFVEDYEQLVSDLLREYPRDEAMSRAVGGGFEVFGNIEADIVVHAGLQSGGSIVDLGCGSGRLAFALSRRMDVHFTGLDVVQALLDYAGEICPASYSFILNRSFSIPVPSETVHVCSAFSVFTHLLLHETYLYLREMHRCLVPGGKVAFSFIELGFEGHRGMLVSTAEVQAKSSSVHLNSFIEVPQITAMAEMIGFNVSEIVPGSGATWPSAAPLGQSVAILTKPN